MHRISYKAPPPLRLSTGPGPTSPSHPPAEKPPLDMNAGFEANVGTDPGPTNTVASDGQDSPNKCLPKISLLAVYYYVYQSVKYVSYIYT